MKSKAETLDYISGRSTRKYFLDHRFYSVLKADSEAVASRTVRRKVGPINAEFCRGRKSRLNDVPNKRKNFSVEINAHGKNVVQAGILIIGFPKTIMYFKRIFW